MNMLVSTLAVSASLVGLAKATVQGFDISSYQPSVDFSAAYSSGARFVIIKVCPHPSSAMQRNIILIEFE